VARLIGALVERLENNFMLSRRDTIPREANTSARLSISRIPGLGAIRRLISRLRAWSSSEVYKVYVLDKVS
jgi:hypothetical protein